MKRFVASALLSVLLIGLPAIAGTQDKKEPEHKLIEFHMALLKHGPNYNSAGMTKEVRSAHIANVQSQLESGQVVIAGPFGDDSDIAGVIVFRAKSAGEARAW